MHIEDHYFFIKNNPAISGRRICIVSWYPKTMTVHLCVLPYLINCFVSICHSNQASHKLQALMKWMLYSRSAWLCFNLENHGWFGQFGTTSIPSALSKMIFCKTLPSMQKGGKHKENIAPIYLQSINCRGFRIGPIGYEGFTLVV